MKSSGYLPARYRVSAEPLRSERRIELVLLVLLALVVLQLLWWAVGLLRGTPIDAVVPAPDSLQVVSSADGGSISAAQSQQLQARPLFWNSRRPGEALELVETEVEDNGPGTAARRLEKLKLTGLFGAGADGGAIMTYKGERQRLRVGDDLDGWTLLSISPTEAEFASAGARDVRRLLPLPVVSIEPSANEMDAAPPAMEDAATEARAPRSGPPRAQVPGSARARAMQRLLEEQTQQQEATLSLGG